MKKKVRAFLKWAGGKYSIVEHINLHLPPANKLIEPFVGAGSVFLNSDYPSYLLNDINPDLINLYQRLQSSPDEIIRDAALLFTPASNNETTYYALREEFNCTLDLHRKAILFLYLNRHGYNGLCRYSLSGKFNVPFGRYKQPYFPRAEMWFFAEKAQKATFTCLSFESVFARARVGHVIYCDPPYVPLSKTASFTSYARQGFNHSSQQHLARLALRAAKLRGIPVIISNHDVPTVRQLYQGAEMFSLKAKRSISQSAEDRKPVAEVIAHFKPA